MLMVNKTKEKIINGSIDVPHCSMKGIALLFCETHVEGARDLEKVRDRIWLLEMPHFDHCGCTVRH